MNETNRLLKIFVALFVISMPMSVKAQICNYDYDACGNVVSRHKNQSLNKEITDTLLTKQIHIDYNKSVSKVLISLTNSTNENIPIKVSLYNASNSTLVKQQTFVGNEGELDLSTESNGIYIVTATDQGVSASSKILKE